MSRSPRARDVARRFPVTLGIAALTLIAFGVERSSGGATDVLTHLRFGALRTDRLVEHGEYYRLLMPLLLHHGWIHLLLNGFAFLQLGALVEALWGGRRLLLFYVICGLAASLTSATLNGVTMPASVGASGAILGLAGLILGTTWYGRAPIRGWLLDLVGQRLLYSVLLTFAIGLGLWLILPLVDNWAHIGGFVCGLLLAAATPDPSEERIEITLPAA
ncbi:MAG TPA: rhomboid family intramembrane serine protease, partial [Deltaproteobacteria bacterium]|nr:rhomboid family intramembrane serine protease [Deltaproteobacteria bacterium]